MYICINVYMYICTYVYICIYVYMYICTCTFIYREQHLPPRLQHRQVSNQSSRHTPSAPRTQHPAETPLLAPPLCMQDSMPLFPAVKLSRRATAPHLWPLMTRALLHATGEKSHAEFVALLHESPLIARALERAEARQLPTVPATLNTQLCTLTCSPTNVGMS